jgi:hypothetical protein
MSSGARVMFWTTIPAMVLSLRQMVEQAMRPVRAAPMRSVARA